MLNIWKRKRTKDTNLKLQNGIRTQKCLNLSESLGIRRLCVQLVCFWGHSPRWAMTSSFRRFLDQTQRRTTDSWSPLDEKSACRSDLYLTTHNTHNRKTSISPLGFEPTISAGERRQTYAWTARPLGTALCVSVADIITVRGNKVGRLLKSEIL